MTCAIVVVRVLVCACAITHMKLVLRKKVIIERLQHFAANANCILLHISDAIIHNVLVLNYYEKCSKMQFMYMLN